MVVAFIGSHGVGKTTVINVLKLKFPEFVYFTEGVRVQMPGFGFKNPYELIDQIGVGNFELLNMNSWSVIDVKTNTILDRMKTIILDRSPVDNYAYYLTLRKEKENYLDSVLQSVAKYYCGLIDLFVYFPVTNIPLKSDEMRLADKNYQIKVDENVLQAFECLSISKNKLYKLTSSSVEDRVNEVIQQLSKFTI